MAQNPEFSLPRHDWRGIPTLADSHFTGADSPEMPLFFALTFFCSHCFLATNNALWLEARDGFVFVGTRLRLFALSGDDGHLRWHAVPDIDVSFVAPALCGRRSPIDTFTVGNGQYPLQDQWWRAADVLPVALHRSGELRRFSLHDTSRATLYTPAS